MIRAPGKVVLGLLVSMLEVALEVKPQPLKPQSAGSRTIAGIEFVAWEVFNIIGLDPANDHFPLQRPF